MSQHGALRRRNCGRWRKTGGQGWRMPNTVVLEKCGTTGIEALLLQAQFRWVGHVVRVEDYRKPPMSQHGALRRRNCGRWRKTGGQGWRVPNTVVLEKWGTTGIEALLLQAQFSWVGHVVRVEDYRKPPMSQHGALRRRNCGRWRKTGGQGRRVPNTVVLEKCGTTGIEALLLQAQFRWVGHVVRVEDYRIPKQVFFGKLVTGKRLVGGPLQRYKDSLKVNLRRCSLDPKLLCLDTQNRSGWRSTCRPAVAEFEAARVEALQDKRARRKQAIHTGVWACLSCPRICSSRIGLFAHMKTHPKWSNPSARRCSPCVCVCVCVLPVNM